MNLDVSSWKFFLLKDLCQISMGNKLDYINMTKDEPCVNFVGRSAGNNGVADKVDLIAGITPYRAGCITVALGGSLGSAYLQTEDFYTSQNVAVLSFEEEISDNAKLFLTSSIMNESKYKYFPFGRELNTHIRTDFGFALPVKCHANGTPVIDNTHKYSTEGYVPDWEFMEQYIKSLHYKPLTTKNKYTKAPELNTTTWKEFRFGSLIKNIYKSKSINKDDLQEVKEGENGIRYITRTGEDNGCELIASMTDIEQNNIEKGNALTIGDTTATCFYQGEDFITGEHIVVVRANWLNEYNALYVCTILGLEMYKYSYGRAFLIDRIKETIIKLPIVLTDRGDPYFDKRCTYSKEGYVPDWQFMENYIKSLPYGDCL